MGSATAFGAVSIVNAIACGKGATVAVGLPTVATVKVEERPGPWRAKLNARNPNSSLAEETVRRAIKLLGLNPRMYSGWVETRTSVPVGVGLKTSSSSAVAMTLAVFSAFGRHSFAPDEVLNCSASASIASGVSVTGAQDDAASALLGGANFSDNLSGKLILSVKLGKPLTVLIRVPRLKSRRNAVGLRSVRRFSKAAEAIFDLGRGGKIWNAMTLNGLLYSSIYGYDPTDLARAIETEALGAGLSGTGPAVAAVFGRDGDPESLARAWSSDGAQVLRTETTDRRAWIDA